MTMVKGFQVVNSDTIVASTEIPGNVQMINVANQLNIAPNQIEQCMLVQINDSVEKNQLIAQSKGLFGMFKSDVKSKSPKSGNTSLINKMKNPSTVCFSQTQTHPPINTATL